MTSFIKFFKSVFSVFLASLLVFCGTLPSSAGIFTLSEKDEIKVGQQAAIQVLKTEPLLKDKTVYNYVNKLGKTLSGNSKRNNLKYYFFVLDNKEVNAFALPGGIVFVYRGLIEQADNESELIGVLAHEIGHITNRHSVEQLEKATKAQIGLTAASVALSLAGIQSGRLVMDGAQLLTQGVLLKFSRDMEREADQEGAELSASSGWNPSGMITFFEKLSKKGSVGTSFFSTHPSPQERKANISSQIKSWDLKNLKTDSEEFQGVKKLLQTLPKAKK